MWCASRFHPWASPFLIYVNDVAGVVQNKLLLYADDSAILVSGKSKPDIERFLSHELERVSHWLVDNKQSLHLGENRVYIIWFKTKVLKMTQTNGTVILHSDWVKYLGITLDQSLSYETMVSFVINKANARLKFLYRKQVFYLFILENS